MWLNISRCSEQARVLGIDFYSVFSRGSQFKVESLMVRIAKAECFMLISPSRTQVLGTLENVCSYLGWAAKCIGMHSLSHGTSVEFLSESVARS